MLLTKTDKTHSNENNVSIVSRQIHLNSEM